MAIMVPETIAFYSFSRNEPENILCWIPESEFDSMIEEHKAPVDIRQFYPAGIEIQVSETAFGMAEIDLGLNPNDRVISPNDLVINLID